MADLDLVRKLLTKRRTPLGEASIAAAIFGRAARVGAY